GQVKRVQHLEDEPDFGGGLARLQVRQPPPAHLGRGGQLGLGQVEPPSTVPDVQSDVSGIVEPHRHLTCARVRSHRSRRVRSCTSDFWCTYVHTAEMCTYALTPADSAAATSAIFLVHTTWLLRGQASLCPLAAHVFGGSSLSRDDGLCPLRLGVVHRRSVAELTPHLVEQLEVVHRPQ